MWTLYNILQIFKKLYNYAQVLSISSLYYKTTKIAIIKVS